MYVIEGAFNCGALVVVTGNEQFARDLVDVCGDYAGLFIADMSADTQSEAHRLVKASKDARGPVTRPDRPAAVIYIAAKGDLWDWFTSVADAVFEAVSPVKARVEYLRSYPRRKWLRINPIVGSAWVEGGR